SRAYPDHIAAATAGKRRNEPAPELPRSRGPIVKVYARRNRSGINIRRKIMLAVRPYLGTQGTRFAKGQSSQVNGSASGRDDIGPDLLQRHGVTAAQRTSCIPLDERMVDAVIVEVIADGPAIRRRSARYPSEVVVPRSVGRVDDGPSCPVPMLGERLVGIVADSPAIRRRSTCHLTE